MSFSSPANSRTQAAANLAGAQRRLAEVAALPINRLSEEMALRKCYQALEDYESAADRERRGSE